MRTAGRVALPDANGHFGPFGGRYVAETLMPALEELDGALSGAREDERFWCEFRALLRDYVGRPTPLTFARRLTEALGGAPVFLKREDLSLDPRAHPSCHLPSHDPPIWASYF